ncbi:MAG: sigma-70 family RNA polymerase sigma factor [Gemmataceae bacterium]
MAEAELTSWTLIRDAAAGDAAARDRFGQVYLQVVRAYFTARWRGARHDVEDAAQDVFVECFRAGGLLAKADPERDGGFRAFLLGAARNVARRHETRVRPAAELPAELPADESGPAEAFERAWARALVREAARIQEQRAWASGPAAVRRVELLRLRFGDGLPIREIAARWGVDAAWLHHQYATARDDFRSALREVVAFHHPDASPAEAERECGELIRLLG